MLWPGVTPAVGGLQPAVAIGALITIARLVPTTVASEL